RTPNRPAGRSRAPSRGPTIGPRDGASSTPRSGGAAELLHEVVDLGDEARPVLRAQVAVRDAVLDRADEVAELSARGRRPDGRLLEAPLHRVHPVLEVLAEAALEVAGVDERLDARIQLVDELPRRLDGEDRQAERVELHDVLD